MLEFLRGHGKIRVERIRHRNSERTQPTQQKQCSRTHGRQLVNFRLPLTATQTPFASPSPGHRRMPPEESAVELRLHRCTVGCYLVWLCAPLPVPWQPITATRGAGGRRGLTVRASHRAPKRLAETIHSNCAAFLWRVCVAERVAPQPQSISSSGMRAAGRVRPAPGRSWRSGPVPVSCGRARSMRSCRSASGPRTTGRSRRTGRSGSAARWVSRQNARMTGVGATTGHLGKSRCQARRLDASRHIRATTWPAGSSVASAAPCPAQ